MTEATLEKKSTQAQLTVGSLINSFTALGASREEVLVKILDAGVDFSSVQVTPEIAGAMAVDYFRSISGQKSKNNKLSAAISLSPVANIEEPEQTNGANSNRKSKRQVNKEPNLLQTAGLPWQLGRAKNVRVRNTNAGITADLAETMKEFLAAIDPKRTSGERILSEIEQNSQAGQMYSEAIAKLFGEPGSRKYKNRLEKMPEVAALLRQQFTGGSISNEPESAVEQVSETQELATV